MDPFSGKVLCAGYNKKPKAYRVYILNQRNTIVIKGVKFEGNFTYRKSHETLPMIEGKYQESLKFEPRSLKDTNNSLFRITTVR